MNTLKDRFFLLRQRQPGINLTDLAQASGVSVPSVHAWFSGKTKSLKHITAMRAAEMYGVNPHWLATGEGEMMPTHGAANVTTLLPAGRRGASGPLSELQAIIDELSPLMRTAARSVLQEWLDGRADLPDAIDAIEQLRTASAAAQSSAVKKVAA